MALYAGPKTAITGSMPIKLHSVQSYQTSVDFQFYTTVFTSFAISAEYEGNLSTKTDFNKEKIYSEIAKYNFIEKKWLLLDDDGRFSLIFFFNTEVKIQGNW